MSFAKPLLTLALLAAPLALHAADLDREYEQIRRIALRDKKVQDAFDRANERLDDKIISLDSALTAYVRAHPAGRVERPEPPRTKTKAAAAPASAPKKSPAPPATGRAYTVKPGDTLTSIAAKQGVSVQKIQATNKIPDAGKLKAGQVLVIPTAR